MDEQPRATDEPTPEVRQAMAELVSALSTCHLQLAAVRDRNDRRKLRLSSDSWETLRHAVHGYTQCARSAGDYPERVLIRINEITTEHAPVLEPGSPLRQAIIRLSLAAYFDKDTVRD